MKVHNQWRRLATCGLIFVYEAVAYFIMNDDKVAFGAHMGGAAAGIVVGVVIRKAPPETIAHMARNNFMQACLHAFTDSIKE